MAGGGAGLVEAAWVAGAVAGLDVGAAHALAALTATISGLTALHRHVNHWQAFNVLVPPSFRRERREPEEIFTKCNPERAAGR